MSDRVIVLEFNELTPTLMDRFIAAGQLPNFARLRAESIVGVTEADEEPPFLEPWIQWVTVHTGLPYAEHQVYSLNDGPKFKHPRIWDIVSDAGHPVWVCGSMNAAVGSPDINGHVLPDPWATEVEAVPRDFFAPYVDLVRAYVQEHTSARPPVTRGDLLRFARFMAANGLSLRTAAATVAQLASERRSDTRWRRASILDRLQWDLFRADYRRLKPTLSTFFLNSTAHYQHYHWREMEPDVFTLKPAAEEMERHGDAILFGYQKMDEIVGECLDLAKDGTTLVLCTALGQQPLTRYEDEGGKQVFRVTDPQQLLKFAGVTAPCEHRPVMAEEFQLKFADSSSAEDALTCIAAMRLNGNVPLMLGHRVDDILFLRCGITTPPDDNAVISQPASNVTVTFYSHFYPLEGLKSGGHHPDGIFWVRTSERVHSAIERKLSLQEIAPTLLALCQVETDIVFSHSPIAEVLATVAGEPAEAMRLAS